MDKDQIGQIVEIVEIDRRQFLRFAGGALVALSSLGLAGCGGSGGGGATAPAGSLTPVSGSVQLPSGFSLKSNSLKVVAGLASTPVTSSNGFSAHVSASGPSLAIVQSSDGRGILFGYLDPTQKTNTINAQSTAVALLYFLIGAYTLPVSAKPQVLALLNANPATATLATTIAKRIAVDPYALEDGDAQIAAALAVAYKAVVPAAKGSRNAGAAAPQTQTVAPVLLIQPTGEIGGWEVNQNATSLAYEVTNHLRRRTQFFLYKTGNQAAGAAVNNFAAAQLITGPTDLAATEKLSLFNSLADLFTGTAPFSPNSSAVMPLTMDPKTIKTLYEIVVVGSSAQPNEPSFFADPKYAAEVAKWRSARSVLNNRSFLIDEIFAIFLEMLGMNALVANEAAIEAAADAIAQIKDAAFAQTVAQAAPNGFAVANLLGIISSSTIVSQKIIASLAPLMAAAEQRSLQAATQATIQSAYGTARRVLFRIFGVAAVIMGAGDIGAVIHDLATAPTADLWTAVVFQPTVSLSPTSAIVSGGGDQNFTATAPSVDTGSVVFDWKLDATFAVMSDGQGMTGRSFESPSNTVNVLTSPSDTGILTLTVEAFQVVGSARTSLGTATAKITMGTGGILIPSYSIITDPQKYTSGIVYMLFSFTPPPNVEQFQLAILSSSGGVVNEIGELSTVAINAGTETIYTPTKLVQADIAGDPSNASAFFEVIENNDPTQTSNGTAMNLGGGKVGFIAFGARWAPGTTPAQAIQATQEFYAQDTANGNHWAIRLDPKPGT